MANPLAGLITMAGLRRPAVLHRCPVCHEPVTEADERLRMRGDYYFHRRCATYRVRRSAGRDGFTGS